MNEWRHVYRPFVSECMECAPYGREHLYGTEQRTLQYERLRQQCAVGSRV